MVAIPLVEQQDGLRRDPVTAISERIERARMRLRRERHGDEMRAEPSYPLYDEGRLVGAIHTPRGTPAFGPGAAAVLLRRET